MVNRTDTLMMRLLAIAAFSVSILTFQPAQALELDWSGQFRAENHIVTGYVTDVGGADGYGVKSGGENTATFQTLFMRVRPKLVVNDNVYIKTEWWLGDPIYGVFGDASPYSTDRRQFYSNQSRGSVITAQRFWGEFQTDFGLVQVGRMPLQYGLGIVWNSGDGLFDRYQSTGDAIRYLAKLGSLTFAPAFVKYSTGNSLAGACSVGAGGPCNVSTGNGSVYDWSLMVKYEVLDEDLELSVNLIRHIINPAQDPFSGYLIPGAPNTPAVSGGSVTTTWDIFAKKRLGKLTLAAEVPIASGDVGGIKRSSVGVAVEATYKASEGLEAMLKAGRAPGQDGFPVGSTPAELNAFFFNPNYRLGMVMFGYQLNNFVGPHTLNNPATSPTQLASPFDNPIVNTNYAALGTTIGLGSKWSMRPAFVYAMADKVAEGGQNFYNPWTRTFVTNASNTTQSKDLGWEFDLGFTYKMDDAFTFAFDSGFYMPGGYYEFSNLANGAANDTGLVFANALRVSVSF